VLDAVTARRADILQHAAIVTPALLLGWLKEDLGLADDATLKPHKRAAKRRALELLEERVSSWVD
jgi:hypothetical protein